MKEVIYKLLAKLGYRIENKKKCKRRKMLFLSKFDIEKGLELVVKAFVFIQNLDKQFSDLKIKDYEDGILLEFDNLKIYLETFEEILIVNEIFVKKDYNFFISEKVILIDIGTNIGIASLFFSRVNNVEKIYAFEPVEDTYKQALLNFKLNEGILKVSDFKNYGLGKSDRKEVFLFNKNVKGNTGLRGSMSSSFDSSKVIEKEVLIKKASVEIDRIKKENPNNKIVVKMDCEGAEYEIFEDLQQSNCIKNIDFFLLEWHDKGSEFIDSILKKNGFNFFSQNLSNKTGMIYAFKSKI
jgi:FkbM family methyltransferase